MREVGLYLLVRAAVGSQAVVTLTQARFLHSDTG